MSGDINNANVWNDADIYVSSDLSATLPATIDDPWPVAWDIAGLLDGQAGVVESEDFQDDETLWSWGAVATRQILARPLYTRTFTFHEYNEVTRGIIYPGSTTTKRYASRPQRVRLGFEFRDGDLDVIEREATTGFAVIRRDGELTRSESGLAVYPMRAVIFPDPNDLSGETNAPSLWDVQRTESGS